MVVTKVNVTSEFCPKCEEVVEKIQLEGYTTCDYEKYDAHDLIGETLDLCNCECESEPELKEPEFGGSYVINGEEVYIREMIYEKPNVIALWSDGTKTRCTCHKEDKWNPGMALLMCVMKKVTCSTEHIGKLLDDWAITSEVENQKITLKDIRKRNKDKSEAENFANMIERASAYNNSNAAVKDVNKNKKKN